MIRIILNDRIVFEVGEEDEFVGVATKLRFESDRVVEAGSLVLDFVNGPWRFIGTAENEDGLTVRTSETITPLGADAMITFQGAKGGCGIRLEPGPGVSMIQAIGGKSDNEPPVVITGKMTPRV